MWKLLGEAVGATALTTVVWAVTNLIMGLGWPFWVYLVLWAVLLPVLWLFTRTRCSMTITDFLGEIARANMAAPASPLGPPVH